ncbi:SEC-C domain-containing protein [Mycobacterium sp. M1]|uniref:SEC-C domain-containing protein n=1 Tax=Mycolicibacter acidiphilus TaxID=2835306 RepID=A0ABS5RPP3_9MYCO|nr:SEC-C domain-containing protein [Mycolicibacter acidiphilus]MBS9535476.1 SEC-C domain-containing protein [Mycolicibacter acidiphilus]
MTDSPDPCRLLSEILTEHGPLDEDAIAQHARDADSADPARIIRRLRLGIDVPTGQLVDGRWVWLPAVLAGRIFTRRVTEEEVSFDLLTISRDLDPIAALCDYSSYQQLADGSTIRLVTRDDHRLLDQLDVPAAFVDAGGALVLAVGTFEALGVAAGDLVGVRLGAAGLVVERVSTVAPSTAGARLSMLLGDRPEFADTLAWTLCAADATLFVEPAAPLSELVADQGLLQHGAQLAPPDFDFARWVFEQRCSELALRHHLDNDDAVTLAGLLELYHRMTLRSLREQTPEVESDEAVEQAGAALIDPRITELLAIETLRHGRFSAGGLRLLADTVEPTASLSIRAACRWLRAVAMEREGDMDGFERELLAAQAIDGTYPLPLLDLARIASDRGDVETGLALLHHAGAGPDHPLAYLLQRHRVAPRTDVGRNAPCWCGSDRKHKRCHLRTNGLPLPDRVGWLYHKAIQYVLFGDFTDLRHEVAWERCRSTIIDDDDAFNAALADPLVIDAVLFEGGGFDEFFRVRGSLLPDDEWELAMQWSLVQRAVFEVEQVHAGRGVTVRDVSTGEHHEVGRRMTDLPFQCGQLICARVVSDGAELQFFALQPISAQQRDPLAALLKYGADPVELVAQLSDGAQRLR